MSRVDGCGVCGASSQIHERKHLVLAVQSKQTWGGNDMKLVFWSSVGVIIYTFLVYPILLVLMAGATQFWSDLRFAFGRGNRRTFSPVHEPFVSMIIPAHNEGAVIAEKMQNCSELAYPKDRIEILVGCDGCSDDTFQKVLKAGLPNVRPYCSEKRSGKPAMLNLLVPQTRGEVLIFSDANTMFTPNSIRSMVRRFADPQVGAVCGELKLLSHDGKPKAEGAYWRFECFLKILESRLNMLVGANGAIFAIRRHLYCPLPPRTINDDFLIAMRIREQGKRVVYDSEACAYEETSHIRQEFRRRVRIGSGDLRALRQTWKLLIPTAGSISLSYWSHKIFRWLVPFAMVAAFASAVALSNDTFYLWCAAAGLFLAGCGAAGFVLESGRRSAGLLHVPCHFFTMNLALMVGFMKDLFGNRSSVWVPTQRVARHAPAAVPSSKEPPSARAAGA
jgi:cellulose synthase/poly-beta-1,6-N-acetylglucosamine synthase-like glycosyltransferase